jgi:hypothetical protein
MSKQQHTRHDEQAMATTDALTSPDLDPVAGGTPSVAPTWHQRRQWRPQRMLGIAEQRYEAWDALPSDRGSAPTGG